MQAITTTVPMYHPFKNSVAALRSHPGQRDASARKRRNQAARQVRDELEAQASSITVEELRQRKFQEVQQYVRTHEVVRPTTQYQTPTSSRDPYGRRDADDWYGEPLRSVAASAGGRW